MQDIKSKIEKIIQRNTKNEYIIDFSFLEGLVPKKFKKLKYGITIGIKLDDRIVDDIASGPTLEYAEHYHQLNTTLNKIAGNTKNMLKRQGYEAEVIKSTLRTKEEKKYPNYFKTLAVEFPHKTAATRSGLGWIGKSALFISYEFGPRVRLVTVLTNKSLDCGQPIKTGLCGTCDICIKKCPAKASNGRTWTAGMKREDFYDAHKCRETAKELSMVRMGIDEIMCGICIAACPIGKREGG